MSVAGSPGSLSSLLLPLLLVVTGVVWIFVKVRVNLQYNWNWGIIPQYLLLRDPLLLLALAILLLEWAVWCGRR